MPHASSDFHDQLRGLLRDLEHAIVSQHKQALVQDRNRPHDCQAAAGRASGFSDPTVEDYFLDAVPSPWMWSSARDSIDRSSSRPAYSDAWMKDLRDDRNSGGDDDFRNPKATRKKLSSSLHSDGEISAGTRTSARDSSGVLRTSRPKSRSRSRKVSDYGEAAEAADGACEPSSKSKHSNSSQQEPFSIGGSHDSPEFVDPSSCRSTKHSNIPVPPADDLLMSEPIVVFNTANVPDAFESEFSGSNASHGEEYILHPLWSQGLEGMGKGLRSSTNVDFVPHDDEGLVETSADLNDASNDDRIAERGSHVKWYVWSPVAASRVAWDFFGCVFMLWDVVVVPLGFIEENLGEMVNIVGWIVPMYWSIDFCSQFFTGYITSTGAAETSHARIIFHYLRTWFIFDFTILIVDWISLLSNDHSEGSFFRPMRGASRFLKFLRMVRLIRLVRLVVRVPEIVQTIGLRFRSENIRVALHVGKDIFGVAMVAHIIACFWYALGSSADDGWVKQHRLENSSLEVKYATSYHWSMTQFIGSTNVNPNNGPERIYAVCVLFIAFVGSASVVSSLTSSMTQLSIISARYMQQISLLKRYLLENNISARLALRIQKNAEFAVEKEKTSVKEANVDLLNLISPPLRIELSYERFGAHLKQHPFFYAWSKRNPTALKQTCHRACSISHLYRGDVLFNAGEICDHPAMKIALSGRLVYLVGSNVKGFCESDSWIGEAVLWTEHWAYRGTSRATMDASILNLDAHIFQTVANKFRMQTFYPAMYAKSFVEALQRVEDHRISDLDVPSCIDVRSLVDVIFNSNEDSSLATWIISHSRRPSIGMGRFAGRILASATQSRRNSQEQAKDKDEDYKSNAGMPHLVVPSSGWNSHRGG